MGEKDVVIISSKARGKPPRTPEIPLFRACQGARGGRVAGSPGRSPRPFVEKEERKRAPCIGAKPEG